MTEVITKDVHSSEYMENGVLTICAGTPSRLSKEFLEKRIHDAFAKAGREVGKVAIEEGYDAIKAEYDKTEDASGIFRVTLDGKTVEIPVRVVVKEIIFDHDLGSDCDDGGAAAMLINAHRDGYCKALAITSCVFNPYASYIVSEMCRYFGVDDIVIGINTERDILKSDDWWRCSYEAVQMFYPEKGREFPELESNTKVIRRALAGSHGNVTLLSTGCLCDFMALFESGADEYSELDGLTLFKENVGHYICGGGKFPGGEPENNFLCDPEAADIVINKYLEGFPITFVGAEVAGIIFSGSVMKQDEYKDYILRKVYERWRPDDCNHNSWDLGVMHYAIFGTSFGYFTVNKGYTVRPYGPMGQITLTEGGCHDWIVRAADVQLLSDVFNKWIVPHDVGSI